MIKKVVAKREEGMIEKVAKRREIERTLRHAQATRRTEVDSWLNAYQDDVAWLLERLR